MLLRAASKLHIKRASAVINTDRASVLLRAASKLHIKRASAVINIKVH